MQLSREDLLVRANAVCKNILMETLNIEIIDFGDDYVIAKMPVNSRVHQPDGVLHGGATVALCWAAHLSLDFSVVVGGLNSVAAVLQRAVLPELVTYPSEYRSV